MNPFDWPGPQFLVLYFGLLLFGGYLIWRLRQSLRTPHSLAGGEVPRLSNYHIAYLVGGPWRAFAAALTRLFPVGAVIEEAGGKFARRGALPKGANALERRIWRAAMQPSTVQELFAASTISLKAIRKQLLGAGLVLSDAADARVRRIPALLMTLIALFGVAKILFGVTRDKPVAFLTIGVILAGIMAVIFLTTRLLRTGRGDAVLESLRGQHAALGETARKNPAGLLPADMPLAVALFGTAALTGTAYAGLHTQLRAATSSSWGGGSCGSGCGSGCGGSSCGGSSCSSGSSCSGGSSCGGGGGCGGCGGGGGD